MWTTHSDRQTLQLGSFLNRNLELKRKSQASSCFLNSLTCYYHLNKRKRAMGPFMFQLGLENEIFISQIPHNIYTL